MELWHGWISLLGQSLDLISSHLGASNALAIILLTLGIRFLLMPLSIGVAWRSELQKQKLRALRPELEALSKRFQGSRPELAAATMALYKRHGIRLIDRLTLVNAGAQGVVGFGLFQALEKAAFGSRFLWIGSLAKADLLLSAIVTVLMLIAMAVAPGALSEPSGVAMIALAVVCAAATMAFMPSAVALYWASSNAAGLVQALILRLILLRQSSKLPG